MKIAKHYPDDFKLKVVHHHLESDEGYQQTSERFDLSNGSLVMQWVRKFGYKSTISPEISNPEKKEKPTDQGGIEAMAKRIKELKQALENEQLKSLAMNTMIDAPRA